MKLIFSERARLRQHFEYPFYGRWTHRKIFRAIWISKKLWKMHFFSLTEGPTKSPHQLYQIQKNASSLFLWPWRIIQTLFDKAFMLNRSARVWGVCYIPITCHNKAWKVLCVDLKICMQIQYILFLKVLRPVRYLLEDLQKKDVLNLHTDLQIDIEHFPRLIMTCFGYVTYSSCTCRSVKHKTVIKNCLNNSVWPEKQWWFSFLDLV